MISYFAFSGLFNFISSFFLGIFTYLKGRKQYPTNPFVLYFLSVSFWSFGYFFWQVSTNYNSALFWSRVLMAGAIFIPIFYFHFIISFLNLVEKYKKILYGGYVLSFLFLLLDFTPYFVKTVEPTLFFPFWPKPGIFYPLHLLMFFGLVSYGWYLLIKELGKIKEKIKKQQIKYFLLGTGIGFTGGSTNYLLWYGIPIPPYGNIFVIFGVLLVTFALLKYHLFEIKVILTEILVGIMGIVLLILPFLMPTANLKLLTFSIFLLFLIFGYLLVKYTHQEIKRKEELEQAYKRIEALSEMKSEFLKVVNHQLRTPVSIIKGMAEMLREGKISKERQGEFVEKLYLSSERLGTILDDILVAHSLTGGIEKPDFSPCQIEEIVERQVEHFRPQAKAKGIEISFKKPKEALPITLADQTMIERIISRLIDNAILYSEKGEVEVSIDLEKENKKEWIRISVKDQGIGLDERDKENLFKLFYRGEKATFMHPNGSGLGLFIVKNYVEAHRGKIEAKSEGRGKGSNFVVTLPVITEL